MRLSRLVELCPPGISSFPPGLNQRRKRNHRENGCGDLLGVARTRFVSKYDYVLSGIIICFECFEVNLHVVGTPYSLQRKPVVCCVATPVCEVRTTQSVLRTLKRRDS